jgi:hypothetical protein
MAQNLIDTAQVALASLLIGVPIVGSRDQSETTRLAAAPWSFVHPASVKPRAFRPEALQAVLRDNPAWERGTPSGWAHWAGAYRGRSVVVIVLESHAATYLPEFGEGSSRSPHTSPRLWRRRQRGVFLSNYFGGGSATRTALWGIGTSLPTFPNPESVPSHTPEASRYGALSRLISAGFKSEWLCASAPEFDGWNVLWGAARAKWWIDPDETRTLDKTDWTSWGMPDEQLYRVALSRIQRLSDAPEPYLLGLMTVSNHPPFRFPKGSDRPDFSADHFGGVGYADFAVDRFLDAIDQIDATRRPLVFITADTGYEIDLTSLPPLGYLNLEGSRIPGLVLLPDGRGAGTIIDELFTHEDAIALLELLVGPPRPDSLFLSGRRTMATYRGAVALSSRSLLRGDGRLFRISDRWRLEEVVGEDSDRAPLKRMQDWVREAGAKLWPAAPSSERRPQR